MSWHSLFVCVLLFLFATPSLSTLPPQCTPSSSVCSYYTQCVEKELPCGPSGYAIGYGGKFCEKFGKNSFLFSSKGKRWIDSVRFCLQNSLQPLMKQIDQGASMTCPALQNFAFESHVQCYTNPTGSGLLSDSVCSLSPLDWSALLWTIKSSFATAFGLTVKQAIDTLAQCSKQAIGQVKVSMAPVVALQSISSDDRLFIEDSFSANIANRLQWPSQSIITQLNDDNQSMTITLIEKDSNQLTQMINSGNLSITLSSNPTNTNTNSASTFTITALSAESCDGQCSSTSSSSSKSSLFILLAAIIGGVACLSAIVVLTIVYRRQKAARNNNAVESINLQQV